MVIVPALEASPLRLIPAPWNLTHPPLLVTAPVFAIVSRGTIVAEDPSREGIREEAFIKTGPTLDK